MIERRTQLKRSEFKRKADGARWQSQTSNAKRRNPSYGTATAVCSVCGKTYTGFPHELAERKSCSRECSTTLRLKRMTRHCKTCGADFVTTPGRIRSTPNSGKYCSRQCSATDKVVTTPNDGRHFNRTADRKWQLAVREKDNHTCQRCGKQEPYIHAHHVAPRSRRPDLKHEVSNGACLCGSCHAWVHHHPIEATALGLLSDETYELVRKRYNNHMVTFNNETLCITDWSRRTGIDPVTLTYRVKHWPLERAFTEPINRKVAA